LIIVDIIADDLAERATKAPLPEEMQVALIETTSGRIVSSWPKQDNPVPPPLLDVLRSAGTERTKLGPFVYTTGDAMKVHAYAHRWTDSTSKSGSPFWTVVTQPEHEVLQPVFDLTQSIQEASKKSLGAVTVESKTFIERQARKGHEKQLQLLRNAGREMRAATAPINGNVGVVLERARKKAVSEIETGLSAMTGPLQKSAAAEMQKAAEAKAEDAANAIGTAADNERDAARMQITQKAKQAANRAAGRMLLNSAWLIPLFLLLALFLATLTARSLVRPINQLVKGTQLLAAGEYHQRIAVRGDDELGRLARAFNGMAGSIETAQAELRQSHDSLAAEKTRIEGIVRASPDGLVMLEPSGQVAFINPAAIRLLNLTEEALPDAPFDLSSLPETAAHRLRACLEIATTDAPTDEPHEYEIQGPPRLVLKLRAVELCSAQGRSYGRLLHMNDVTRERIIDEMKSDFISLVSHELRTPLTSILGFSSYMLTGKLGAVVDTQKLALESIHRQAKRLSAIISDFLDISRIESGRIEMRKEPVPVAQIAARVVEDLRPQATEKHIDVSAHIEDGSLPIVAMGDEQRITQVFTNLVGNALKFTEANGRIDVVLSRKNGEVYCSVKDTGCGIPEDELDRVFDRFYQVEKVVTRKSGGTGLGLAIVKNIVEAHGGQIRIKSRLGEGTEVAFSLPSSDEAA
jgi:signal transduction histidine kinase